VKSGYCLSIDFGRMCSRTKREVWLLLVLAEHVLRLDKVLEVEMEHLATLSSAARLSTRRAKAIDQARGRRV